MKTFVFLFFTLIQSSTLQVVEEFHKLDGEKEELAFIKLYSSSSDPDIKAYVVAIKMKQLEYMYNPIKQMSLFSDYKTELQDLANKHSSNVHVRYVRLLIQEETPSFLGYKDDIAADKAFLKKMISAKDDTDYLDKYIYKTTSL